MVQNCAVYYNTSTSPTVLADCSKVFYFYDTFDRTDAATGNSWVEHEGTGSSTASSATGTGLLNFTTNDTANLPWITRLFTDVDHAAIGSASSSTFNFRIGFNWFRGSTASPDSDYRVMMQLVNSAVATDPDASGSPYPFQGAGVSLVWGMGSLVAGVASPNIATEQGGTVNATARTEQRVGGGHRREARQRFVGQTRSTFGDHLGSHQRDLLESVVLGPHAPVRH
ncbi:MAG: hypothetical protein U1F43_16670 [Myxococcota bacterium]